MLRLSWGKGPQMSSSIDAIEAESPRQREKQKRPFKVEAMAGSKRPKPCKSTAWFFPLPPKWSTGIGSGCLRGYSEAKWSRGENNISTLPNGKQEEGGHQQINSPPTPSDEYSPRVDFLDSPPCDLSYGQASSWSPGSQLCDIISYLTYILPASLPTSWALRLQISKTTSPLKSHLWFCFPGNLN